MPIKPRITLWFEGMMVLFISDRGSHCTLGVLNQIPNHTFLIEIWETHDFGDRRLKRSLPESEIKKTVSLTVPAAVQGTTLYQGPSFDRDITSDDPDDFRWVLDLQADVYKEEVKVDKEKFRSLLKVDCGTYFASRVSSDEIYKMELSGNTHDPSLVGKVATAIGGYIYLAATENPRPAIFRNGNEDLSLAFDRGVNYEIRVSHSRRVHNHLEHDAQNYETPVPSSRSGNRRVRLFQPDVKANEKHTDPHAECLSPRLPLYLAQ